MRELSRRERVIELLRTLADAREPLQSGNGKSSAESHSFSYPKVYLEGSYRELEATLRRLRAERPGQYWHVCERYLRCERKVIEAKVKKGKPTLPQHCELAGGLASIGASTARVSVFRWDERVRMEKVRAGVEFLVEHFPVEPQLPLDFLAVAAA